MYLGKNKLYLEEKKKGGGGGGGGGGSETRSWSSCIVP